MSNVKVKRRAGRPRGSNPHAVHDALLSAAREILSENGGSQGLTLTEVAQRAGVNPAMVNYHFGSKSELISALIREALSESLRRIGNIGPSSETPDAKLRRRVRSVIELYQEHPYISRLLKEQVFYSDGEARKAYLQGFFPGALRATKNILDEGVASGLFREVDHVLFWATLIGICEFFFMARPILQRSLRRNRRDRSDLESFADYTTEILLHGIARSESKSELVGKSGRSPRSTPGTLAKRAAGNSGKVLIEAGGVGGPAKGAKRQLRKVTAVPASWKL
ncbi:MAG: TetR/AcrR family transcriptional regulator [Bradyrhizobium sp.]|jgi:AcrR family transcriptional regulator|nr:TetR/AcrR family transcriptional regulator [Bradyrhizobium sp.]